MPARKRNIHRGSFRNKREFEVQLQYWLDKARIAFGELPHFDLVYFAKGKTAGFWRAYRESYGRRHALEFNVEAIENHFEDMVQNTIPHEIAHMIDFHLHGRSSGHGRRWQAIMLKLGVQPKRCHTMQLSSARRTKQFRYVAQCGTEIWLSTQRHNKVQRGSIFIVRVTKGKIAREHFTGQYKVKG